MNILEKIATEAGSRFIEKRIGIANENKVPASSIQQGNARNLINRRKEIVADSKMMGNLRDIIHNANSMNINSVKGNGTFSITGRGR